MEEIAEYKTGDCSSPRCPLVEKFLYVALVLINTYQYAKFQLSSSINFGDIQGVLK